MIFVFGSNLSGRHGLGAAKTARLQHGAKWGIAEGRTGNSYAIPTVDGAIRNTLPLDEIQRYVDTFKRYAERLPLKKFQVTCIGCGLAGLRHQDVAPMFIGSPQNCLFDTAWQPWLGPDVRYWGHF